MPRYDFLYWKASLKIDYRPSSILTRWILLPPHIASCVYYLLPELTVLPVMDPSLWLIGASNLNLFRQSFLCKGIPAGPGSTFLHYSKIGGYAFLFQYLICAVCKADIA